VATYRYIARSAGGEEITGVMQADNEAAVARSLDDRQLYPVAVTEKRQAAAGRPGKVRARHLSVMYGQLADLLRAGVPMLRALETLVRATTNARLASIARDVQEGVSGGKTLADSMAEHPKVFTFLHVAMVRAGERAGFLEEVLANLSAFLERQDELRSKVRGAMIYPLVLTTIGTLGMIGMLVILVPRFKPFFVNADLPAPTLVLFAVSDLLVDHKMLLIALAALVVLSVRMLLKSRWGARWWQDVRLRLPVVGKAIRMVSITRFCRILGTMIANGVPILQSLAISKDATGSDVLAGHIETAAENVRAGQTLSEPLKAGGLFPTEIIEMIAVGEESNQLEKVLLQIADTVERRVNRQVDAAVRLIEPLILVVIAAAIGFMAVGLMYPIFTMSQTLK